MFHILYLDLVFQFLPMLFRAYFTYRKPWLSCLITLLIPTTSLADNTTDYVALLSFKSLIFDPIKALSTWNTSSPLYCEWQGVTCGNTNHPERVTALELNSVNLAGPISPDLSNLTFLTNLDLGNNQFKGNIPQEIDRLRFLQHLNLSYNSLSSKIPANLSQCSDLREVDLSNNMLVGKIPVELGSLTRLLRISLSENTLSGLIPASFGNMTALTGLYLYNAGVEGKIPDSLGKLRSLTILQVSMNRLSGEIPRSLYNLSSIQYFVAGGNQLAGTLPSDMFDTLLNLEMVLLYGNGLSGSIPISLSNASKLVEIDLKENSFSGMVPSSLGNLKNLYWVNLNGNLLEASQADGWDFLTSLTNCTRLGTLGLSMNKLGGVLPSSIANLSSHLDILAIGDNKIAGTIPEGIGNLMNLSVLLLNGNQLSGFIPHAIGSLSKLYALRLSYNNFHGQIPSSFGNLTQLNQLDLRASGIEGEIPVSLGNCKGLNKVDLSENKLTGVIPKELVSIASLSILLDLSQNFLVGDLPFEVSEMSHLATFDISNNRLSGIIPSSLGYCQSLEYLYMQNNLFDGTIPVSLSKLRGLQELDISNNKLSGLIPDILGMLSSLDYLNLSVNNLEGKVPEKGIFLNASGISVEGNHKLCGGAPQLHLPTCSALSSKTKGLSNALKAVISVGSVLLSVIILFTVFTVIRWKNSRVKYDTSTSSGNLEFMKITYAEIRRATDGFSPSNLIGTGSFGSVYKGILDSVENVVAVKVLNLQVRGALRSFVAECEALRNIRHRNLVSILTACSTVDSQGDDFKALVLEFMPNGSLDEWLHQQRGLSLIRRLNIAIDVAFALDYLHHHTHRPIVHCDLKPSNVLLDEDMRAHVSDFGLARFLYAKAGNSDENQTSSTRITGSIGYLAPEYGMGVQVSTRGDVFSYGILLLEMLTCKRPTEEIFKDGVGLRKFVEMAFPDQVFDIIDPYILLPENDAKVKRKCQDRLVEEDCLVSVLRIGLACSREDPRERMEMRSVVKEMVGVRDLLLGSM